MPRVTRWRLTWWLVGETCPRQAQWYSHACKLCACKRAWQFGKAYAKVKLAPEDAIRWEVSRMDLHGGEPQIVATSGSVGKALMRSHAHRQSDSGSVRAAISAPRSIGEAGSIRVQAGRWSGGKSDVVPASGGDGTDGIQS